MCLHYHNNYIIILRLNTTLFLKVNQQLHVFFYLLFFIFILFFILYINQQKHNYNDFINYYASTCFDTIVSSLGSSRHDSVETCRSVIIYKFIVIVFLLVDLSNSKKMHGTYIKIKRYIFCLARVTTITGTDKWNRN